MSAAFTNDKRPLGVGKDERISYAQSRHDNDAPEIRKDDDTLADQPKNNSADVQDATSM